MQNDFLCTWCAWNRYLNLIINMYTLPSTRFNAFCLLFPFAEAVMLSLLPMLPIHTVAQTGVRDHQVMVINVMICYSTNLFGVAAGIV